MIPKLTLKNIFIPKDKRIHVISDIHGHLSLFKKVLEKAVLAMPKNYGADWSWNNGNTYL